jgi:hypothetical protein
MNDELNYRDRLVIELGEAGADAYLVERARQIAIDEGDARRRAYARNDERSRRDWAWFRAPLTSASQPCSAWKPTEPKRCDGLATPIFRVLKAAHEAGREKPSARIVLEDFRANKPAGIARVLADSCDYLNSKGDEESADLESIRKRITAMTAA